ncbi:hypothetical protein BDZ89DRAFT_1013649 [Hymenopellis radicata]|nr:hypothetical protein BDZ89DRAFT_1013649 [Hymenopellis radicata]
MKSLHDALSAVVGKTYTAFLFSQYDIVTAIGPTLAVAMALAGPTDIWSFIQGFVWMELHLISFEIKNQMVGLEEDRLTKPNRPIVSGRISLNDAQTLYQVVFALSFLYSVYHGLVACSVLYLVAIVTHNEVGLSRNWFLKSFLGSIGYVCYCWGTTVIFDHNKPLSQTSAIAVILSGVIHTTTGHAQDFRDRSGDAAIGRKTLAIMLPQWLGRWSLMALVYSWTGGLVYYWQPPIPVSVGFAALGVNAMVQYCLDYSEEADRKSYWWYNIWLITAHILPVFKRLADAGIKIPFSM